MKSRTSILAFFTLLSLVASGCSSGPKVKTLSKKEKIQGLLPIAEASITEYDSTGALQVLNQVQDLDDSIPEVYYLYTLAYLQKNETDLAITSAKKSIQLAPKYSAAKNALGKIYLDQGKYSESEPLLLEAANDLLFREAYLAKTNLGILNFKKMNYEKAESWLTKAVLEEGPLSCIAYYYRGKVNLAQEQLLKAERDFEKSTKGSCSGASDMHLAFAQALVREKKYDLARAKLIEIQMLFPSTPSADQATQFLRELP